MRAEEHIENLNRYIKEYPASLSFDKVDLTTLQNDPQVLGEAISFIINLFCKIGVNADLAPTMDGILLDSCLEFLTELREEYNS